MKDVDELIRSHVPRGETWEKERTKIRQHVRVNGHHSLQSLSKLFKVPLDRLLGEFTEYSTAVAATGHTCAVAIAALENETVFVRDPRAFLVSISRNTQFMILTGDVNDLATNGSPQVKAVIGTL
eukprot:6430074-Heterocapsa_arctica.AAC.1